MQLRGTLYKGTYCMSQIRAVYSPAESRERLDHAKSTTVAKYVEHGQFALAVQDGMVDCFCRCHKTPFQRAYFK